MKVFCKVFETKTTQVLVELSDGVDDDTGEDEFCVSLNGWIVAEGEPIASVTESYKFSEEDKALEGFHKITQEQATNFEGRLQEIADAFAREDDE